MTPSPLKTEEGGQQQPEMCVEQKYPICLSCNSEWVRDGERKNSLSPSPSLCVSRGGSTRCSGADVVEQWKLIELEGDACGFCIRAPELISKQVPRRAAVSAPVSPSVSAFIEGKACCAWYYRACGTSWVFLLLARARAHTHARKRARAREGRERASELPVRI